MTGNPHVRFLGGSGRATARTYPVQPPNCLIDRCLKPGNLTLGFGYGVTAEGPDEARCKKGPARRLLFRTLGRVRTPLRAALSTGPDDPYYRQLNLPARRISLEPSLRLEKRTQ
jgi:hypothetical protein